MSATTDSLRAEATGSPGPQFHGVPRYPFPNPFHTCLSLAGRWNGELLRFAQERWNKDLDTLVRLASCGSPAEVFCVQHEAAADFAADYLSEIGRLFAGWNAAGEADTEKMTAATAQPDSA